MVKKDADFSIQNKIGNNALMIASQIGNSDILGMTIMKMLNDELNNKLIGKHLLSSKAILNQTNKQGHDILMIATMAKSKECIGILLDIANMEITKEHLSIAKEYTSDNSKLYNYIKKRFHAQDGIYRFIYL
jgi:ankyrin repeat protein